MKKQSKVNQNKAKEQKGGFLGMWLIILGASLLGNMPVGKGINRAGDAIIRAGYGSKKDKNF